MPGRVVVTKEHFDPEQTQEIFRLFIKSTGYEVGDKLKRNEFRRWVGARVKEYKKLNDIDKLQPVSLLGTERYLEYLRSYVDNIPGQTTIFDFLE